MAGMEAGSESRAHLVGRGWGWDTFAGMKLGRPADCIVHSASLPLTVKALPHVEDLLAQSQISLSFGMSIMISCLF